MNTLDFLKRVLPSEGIYVAVLIRGKTTRQLFFQTVEELANAVQQGDAKEIDAYYAISSFKEEGSRKFDNAHLTQVVAMDIDCGEGKQYADWKEGLKAFGAFAAKVNTPAPMIVLSGGGLHVYWCLSEALRPEEWKPLADGMKALALNNGLAIDPTVTGDISRILRPTQTHNYKGDTPRPVKLLLDAAPVDPDHLRSLVPEHVSVPAVNRQATNSKLLQDMAVKSDFPLSNGEAILNKCQQINWMYENRADKTKVNEPMWYRMIGVAAYCHNAEDVAIKWSEGHPNFDPQATIDKMNHWKDGATGPSLCEKFEEVRPGGCKGCKFKDKIGSPVRLGVQFQEVEISHDVLDATAYEIELPKPYKRTDKGIKATIDDTDIDVSPFDLYPVGYGKDESLGYEVVRYHWKRPHVGWQPLNLRQAFLTDGSREFAGAIADQGIVLTSKKQTEYFQHMLRSYMDKLRQQRTMTNLYSTMGWKNNYTEWVMGDTILRRNKDGTVAEEQILLASSSQRLGSDLYGAEGTLEEWRDFTRLLPQGKFIPIQFVLGVSLSSPFYDFTGLKNTVISLFGETGSGKTLAQLWGQSVWGDPIKLHFAAKYTQNALFSRFGLYCHMPLTVDETTMVDVKDVGDLIYWFTQGRDKARLNRHAEEREAREWAAPSILSTNKSMSSKLSASGLESAAQMARLLELETHPHPLFTNNSSAGREIHKFVTSHYGTAGREFMKRLLELGPDSIKAMIDESFATFSKRYHCKFAGDERFWEQAIVLADLALRLAHEWGLILYKPKECIEWALIQIGAIRKVVADQKVDGLDMLTEFLNEHASTALTVWHTGNNKPTPDMSRIPRSDLRIRFDLFRKDSATPCDHGSVTFDRTFYRKWLSQQGYDYKAFMHEINEQSINVTPKSNKSSLGKDSPIKIPQCYVISVNLNHPRLKAILDDADEAADSATLGNLALVGVAQ